MNDTVATLAAMPHRPVMVGERVVSVTREGRPYCPVKPLPRVSVTPAGSPRDKR